MTNGNDALLALMGDQVVAYHPLIARVVESVKAAVWLSQLLYWDKWHADEEGWITAPHRSPTRLSIEHTTALSEREHEHARGICVDLGVVEYRLAGVPQMPQYRVNRERLAELVTTFLQANPEWLPKPRRTMVRVPPPAPVAPALPRDPLDAVLQAAQRAGNAETVIRAWNLPVGAEEVCLAFAKETGVPVVKGDKGKWLRGALDLVVLNTTMPELREAVGRLQKAGMTVTHPGAVSSTLRAVIAERNKVDTEKTVEQNGFTFKEY